MWKFITTLAQFYQFMQFCLIHTFLCKSNFAQCNAFLHAVFTNMCIYPRICTRTYYPDREVLCKMQKSADFKRMVVFCFAHCFGNSNGFSSTRVLSSKASYCTDIWKLVCCILNSSALLLSGDDTLQRFVAVWLVYIARIRGGWMPIFVKQYGAVDCGMHS